MASRTTSCPRPDECGVGIVPYFPLASGMLTGKYKRGEDFPEGSRFAAMSYFASVASDENFDRIEALAKFAEARGHSLLELAVAWLAAQDGVGSVICGATTPEQVHANASRRRLEAHGGRPRGHSGHYLNAPLPRANRCHPSQIQPTTIRILTARLRVSVIERVGQ